MSEIDPKVLGQAAETLRALRRRACRAALMAVGSLALVAVVLVALDAFRGALSPIVPSLTLLPGVVLYLVWWVRSAAAWIALTNFRCPRCAKRFNVAWWGNWPSSRCKHCELVLSPTAKAKPTGVHPLDF